MSPQQQWPPAIAHLDDRVDVLEGEEGGLTAHLGLGEQTTNLIDESVWFTAPWTGSSRYITDPENGVNLPTLFTGYGHDDEDDFWDSTWVPEVSGLYRIDVQLLLSEVLVPPDRIQVNIENYVEQDYEFGSVFTAESSASNVTRFPVVPLVAGGRVAVAVRLFTETFPYPGDMNNVEVHIVRLVTMPVEF
jgi:hypothetical protein